MSLKTIGGVSYKTANQKYIDKIKIRKKMVTYSIVAPNGILVGESTYVNGFPYDSEHHKLKKKLVKIKKGELNRSNNKTLVKVAVEKVAVEKGSAKKDNLNNGNKTTVSSVKKSTTKKFKKVKELIFDPKYSSRTLSYVTHKFFMEQATKMELVRWSSTEISLTSDAAQWRKNKLLTPDVKKVILAVLGFFNHADDLVNENNKNMMGDITLPEIKVCLGIQVGAEATHQLFYNRSIEVLTGGKGKKELNAKYNKTVSFKKKIEWCEKYLDSSLPFKLRVIAYILVEGLIFAAEFAVVFWARDNFGLSGIGHGNRMVSVEEDLHMKTGIGIHKLLIDKATDKEIVDICKSCVDTILVFVNRVIGKKRFTNMNAEMMSNHVKYVADSRLALFGIKPIYNVKDPFCFQNIGTIQANFFEKNHNPYNTPDNRSQSEISSIDGSGKSDDLFNILDDF